MASQNALALTEVPKRSAKPKEADEGELDFLKVKVAENGFIVECFYKPKIGGMIQAPNDEEPMLFSGPSALKDMLAYVHDEMEEADAAEAKDDN